MSEAERTDFTQLSDEAIHDVIARAQGELDRRHQARLTQVQDKIKGLAESIGMTPEEVVLKMPRSHRPKAGNKKDIRFRNHENHSETWTGRGKRPNWLVRALAAGADLDSFRL